MNLALADVITISLGNNTWGINLDAIMYLVIAAVIGLIAEFIVGWRVPFGIVGSLVAGIIGVWLMTKVLDIQIDGFHDPTLYGVPLVHGIVGAIILVAVWHLLTIGNRPRRRFRRRYIDA
jgi:Predicted membrane protein